MKNVVIIGATGFIGSHVAEQFYLAGYEVTALVRETSNCTEIERFCNTITRVDFNNETILANAIQGQSLLVNCVAYVKTHESIQNLNKVQVDLIGRITNAAIKAGIQRYFLLSTVEIYGFLGDSVKSEKSPYLPSHNFQHSFVAKEQHFLQLMANSGLEYIILQPASTIGRREAGSSFFRSLFEMHQQGTSLLLKKGNVRVSLVDTRDIGRAFVHFAQNSEIKNEIFLQKGYDTTWYELKKMMDLYEKKVSKEIQIPVGAAKVVAKVLSWITPQGREPILPPLAVDLFSKEVLIDDQKLQNTGFKPLYSLSDSVADAIQSFEGKEPKKINELYHWKSTGNYFHHEGYQIFYKANQNVNKDTILFLHGFPSSSYDYKFLWDELSEHFNLVTLDFLGFGFSDKPRKIYSIFEQVTLVKKLIAQLGLSKINLVAHNYGTIVVQELLAQFNAQQLDFTIDRLVLLNGSVFPALYKATSTQKLLTSPIGRFLPRLVGNNKKYFAQKFSAVFGRDTAPSQAEIDEFWQLNRFNDGTKIPHRILSYIKERKINAKRWVDALEQTSVRLKMINGIDDPVSGIHIVEEYLKRIKSPEVVKLPNIGHYPQVENPKEVLKEVYAFMS